MAISSFRGNVGGSQGEASGPQLAIGDTLSITTVNAGEYREKAAGLPAGTYTFNNDSVSPADFILIFVNDGADEIFEISSTDTTKTIFTLNNSTRLLFVSDSASATFSLTLDDLSNPQVSFDSITEITTSETVVLYNSALVVALGAGGNGGNAQGTYNSNAFGGGGGSGYLATGVLAPGTYSAVIGASGGTTSIGNISAAGGSSAPNAKANNNQFSNATSSGGGAGGSGGGAAPGGNGGIRGADGNEPSGYANQAVGSGSGVNPANDLITFVSPNLIPDFSGNSGGGVYAGGSTSYSNASDGSFGGGGQGAGSNSNQFRSGGSGGNGKIWIREFSE